MRQIAKYSALLTIVTLAALPSRAAALQPLRDFVSAARETNNENRRAAAQKAQSDAEASTALGQALPSIDVRGIYAYSQFEPNIPQQNGGQANAQTTSSTSGLVPRHIYFFQGGITVPINVGAWEKTRAANAGSRAADAGERAAKLDVERIVTRAYFDLLGSEAVLRAAKHRLELGVANQAVVKAQEGEGEASRLDAERTRADVAHAEGDVADAENNVLRARRTLYSQTGVVPGNVAEGDFPIDDLHDEGPLESWTGRANDARPQVEQAAASRESSEKSLAAAKARWLPTLSAQLSENYTNATENLGRKDFYSFFGIASWHLDLSVGPQVRAAHAAVDAAKASESQARIDANDAVYFSWLQVDTDVKKSRAAITEADAAARTAVLAQERFKAGAATQIDVLQSEQSYIEAEVAKIRVLADLAYARTALRLSVADGKGR